MSFTAAGSVQQHVHSKQEPQRSICVASSSSGSSTNHTEKNCNNLDAAAATAEFNADSKTESTNDDYAAPTPPQPPSGSEHQFVHLNETRQKIYGVIASFNDISFKKNLMQLLVQFERAIREEFQSASKSPLMCRKLARILSGLTELIQTIARRLDDMHEYRLRICEIIALYIACELCAAQEPTELQATIINRIHSMLWLHIGSTDASAGAHKELMLRTLCAIPRLFNRKEILKSLYGRFLPQWTSPDGVTQTEMPDKLYIQYIIIFYCWLSMESDTDARERIIHFAEKFMRPARTLKTNITYSKYLPEFSARRTATRCILEKLREHQLGYFSDLRLASNLDNRLPIDKIVDLDSDDEETPASLFPRLSLDLLTNPAETLSQPTEPPDFLENLVHNARKLEPSERTRALFSSIDREQEIIDVRDSDDDEMFSVNFNVPAYVDASSDAPAAEEDGVPITRIYPSNLRTYQRATSSGQREISQDNYTIPRIVNSYSCRRDSMHMVSTSSPGLPPESPHLVDQCVQTVDSLTETCLSSEDARSTCVIYSGAMLRDASETNFPPHTHSPQTSMGTKLLYVSPMPYDSCEKPPARRQQSSQNSRTLHIHGDSTDSSETSLRKKQVTFNAKHLIAHEQRPSSSSSNNTSSISMPIKPVIKHYKTRQMLHPSQTSLSSTSSTHRFKSLKWLGRREHIQSSQRMFAKHENLNNKDSCTPLSIALPTPTPIPIPTLKSSTAPAQGKSKHSVTSISMATLTPTNSDNSFSTTGSNRMPTTLKALRRRHCQRAAPTPPASSNGSSALMHRESVDSLNSLEMQQLQSKARRYAFNRRQFSKVNEDEVRFYNQLLKAQRSSLKRRRLEQNHTENLQHTQRNQSNKKNKQNSRYSLNTQKRQSNDDGPTSLLAMVEKQHQQLSKEQRKLAEAEKQRNRLQEANEKLRSNIKQLEQDLASICVQFKPTAALTPKVRLKRLNMLMLQQLERQEQPCQHGISDTSGDSSLAEFTEKRVLEQQRDHLHKHEQRNKQQPQQHKLQHQLQQQCQLLNQVVSPERKAKPKRRRFGHHWYHKKKRRDLPPTQQLLEKEDQAAPQMLATEPVATMPMEVTLENAPSEPLPVIPMPPEPEPDLGIAAYVTLAANGECCDETAVKELTLPRLDADTTLANTLDIELATCNVPVYLLNGESRDVPTPVAACNDSIPLQSELLSKPQHRTMSSNYLKMQHPNQGTSRLTLGRSMTINEGGSGGGDADAIYQCRMSSKRRETFGGMLAQYNKLMYTLDSHNQCTQNDGVTGDYANEKRMDYNVPIHMAYVQPVAAHWGTNGERRPRSQRKLNS